MNLFLDDERTPNKFLNDIRTWEIVRSFNEFVKFITEKGLPKFISFDHDLAFEHYKIHIEKGFEPADYDSVKEKTGYHCAKWLIEYCQNKNLELPDFQVHSMNPIGADNIYKLLEGFRKFQKEK
jgi:hypothetical protein